MLVTADESYMGSLTAQWFFSQAAPERLALEFPQLQGDLRRARWMEEQLSRMEGILHVAACPQRGEVCVQYDVRYMSQADLERCVRLMAN